MFPLVLFVAFLLQFQNATAAVSPDLSVLVDGYNIICKVPCLSCPFLVESTASAQKEPWSERRDDNALLLNVTLSYHDFSLRINSQELWPTPSLLPRIYASQVLQDISTEHLQSLVDIGQLDSGAHGAPGGGGYFGLSYAFSINHVPETAGWVLRFDMVQVWSGLLPKPILVTLNHPDQTMLEIVVMKRPTLSSLESPAFEIADTRLVPRPTRPPRTLQVMNFLEWDEFGRIGTWSHYVAAWNDTLLRFLDAGVTNVLALVFGIVVLVVVVCALCVAGFNLFQDDYQQAQAQKVKGGDEERRVGFRGPEELGLLGRGRVIGIGKSD